MNRRSRVKHYVFDKTQSRFDVLAVCIMANVVVRAVWAALT